MKIRIFALAKELGMDSKELIDLCATAGIQLKNSALASISPEERDVVLGLLKKGGPSKKPAETPAMAPIRDDVPDVAGKLRDIRTMGPRPHAGRTSVRTEPVEEPGDFTDTPDLEAVDVPVEPVAEPAPVEHEAAAEAAPTEAPIPVESETAPAETTASPRAPDSEEASKEPPSPSKEPTAPESPKRPAASPLRRDDYISAAGTNQRRGSSTYDMIPRGSVSSEAGARSGSKPRERTSRVSMVAAVPTIQLPVRKPAKPTEGPAQQPVMRLTKEMIEHAASGPLTTQLRGRDDRKAASPMARLTRSGKTLEQDLMDLVEQNKKGVKGGPVTGAKRGVPDTRRRSSSGKLIEEDGSEARARRPRFSRVKRKGSVVLKTTAEIELPITVRSLSEAIGRPAKDLLKLLFQRGQMVTINENLTEELAIELSLELGVDLTIHHERDVESELASLLEVDDEDDVLVSRPPIVTILGHVDHGKTTLLDKLRRTNVAAGEAGGITQHIASYQVEHNGQRLTFVDTPGHAAFGEMRARGANVTDIVVLVVAADDGVMPQTEECISHAKSAGVPIVVALNKIDLATANPQRVLQQLASHEILPTEWGGEVEVVRTSGTSGEGLDNLLETLLLTAELHEFKASVDRPAVGVCLESFRDEGRGSLAWLIVQKGTLRVGDVVLCGQSYGRIRAMYDDLDREITEAGPSVPLKIAGLDMVPNAGDHFFVLEDLDEARQIAESRRQRGRVEVLAGRRQRLRTLDDILTAARGGTVQDLPLILKVDSPGSLEALRHEISKIAHPEVRVQIIHEGVGGVNESDVALASAAGAIIVAFHVVPEDRAEIAAERDGVDIRRYDIIYEVTEHIKRSLEGLLIPEKKQVMTGRAIVLRTFAISRIGTVAGCRVLGGVIERSNRIQLIRDQRILNEYPIASLKREKEDAREVREGFECGIRLDGFNDVKEGDILQAYRVEEVKRTLE